MARFKVSARIQPSGSLDDARARLLQRLAAARAALAALEAAVGDHHLLAMNACMASIEQHLAELRRLHVPPDPESDPERDPDYVP